MVPVSLHGPSWLIAFLPSLMFDGRVLVSQRLIELQSFLSLAPQDARGPLLGPKHINTLIHNEKWDSFKTMEGWLHSHSPEMTQICFPQCNVPHVRFLFLYYAIYMRFFLAGKFIYISKIMQCFLLHVLIPWKDTVNSVHASLYISYVKWYMVSNNSC